MRILVTLILFALAALSLAQDATPTESESAPATAPPPSTALEMPFLQSDLELMVGNVQRPNGLVWFNDALFTVCNGDWTIYKIDDRSGETVTFVFGVRDGNSLVAEETDAGFNLWTPDPETGTLWKVDQRRASPEGVATRLEAPWGLSRLDEDGFLVTDTRSNSILALSQSGERETLQSELRAPTGIARQGDKVYFANGGSARRGIEYFELREDGSASEVMPLVSGLQNATNIMLGADGYLYFAYALGTRGVVGRIDPERCHQAGCGNQEVEMVVFSDIPAPLAITLSDDLRLFLHSRYRPEIYWAQLPA